MRAHAHHGSVPVDPVGPMGGRVLLEPSVLWDPDPVVLWDPDPVVWWDPDPSAGFEPEQNALVLPSAVEQYAVFEFAHVVGSVMPHASAQDAA